MLHPKLRLLRPGNIFQSSIAEFLCACVNCSHSCLFLAVDFCCCSPFARDSILYLLTHNMLNIEEDELYRNRKLRLMRLRFSCNIQRVWSEFTDFPVRSLKHHFPQTPSEMVRARFIQPGCFQPSPSSNRAFVKITNFLVKPKHKLE